MSLPASLLSAIAAPERGRVVLVTGAGCSFEEPTNLPLAWKCSQDAHRKLVTDGILSEGDCTDPDDLSILADTVKRKQGGQQAELVRRLPVTPFKNAKPNEGHKIAAALMVEGAISNVVTLNFDMALSHALSELGVRNEVSVVAGPEQHDQLGQTNVIYLHRSILADPEELVLTTDALDTAWQDAWEELVARCVLISPVTVFAGMGSSCGVLRHSGKKLKDAIGDKAQLLLADPGDPSESRFAQEMDLKEENCVRLGWVDFMRGLGQRFHTEMAARIKQKCEELSRREGWVDPVTKDPLEDSDRIASTVESAGLLSFGKARAAWILESCEYVRLDDGHLSSVADLLLAVACLERTANVVGALQDDGHVLFKVAGKPDVRILLVDGRAKSFRWLSLETALTQKSKYSSGGTRRHANHIVACGVSGPKPTTATPPQSIIDGESDEDDIIDGGASQSFYDVDEVRVGALEGLLS